MGAEHLIKQWKKSGIHPGLLEAFRSVSREDFILKEFLREAYGDYPLPIGYGQTISQPTTVMIMLNLLELKPDDNVLEIGAGSGYNAALISKRVNKVTSLEIIPELTNFARNNIKKAGIDNVEVVNTDGSVGYKKNAPYSKIIITAACPKIPKPVMDQLDENGMIVGPVGTGYSQVMVVGRKKKKEMDFSNHGYFTFVPLKGKHGF